MRAAWWSSGKDRMIGERTRETITKILTWHLGTQQSSQPIFPGPSHSTALTQEPINETDMYFSLCCWHLSSSATQPCLKSSPPHPNICPLESSPFFVAGLRYSFLPGALPKQTALYAKQFA